MTHRVHRPRGRRSSAHRRAAPRRTAPCARQRSCRSARTRPSRRCTPTRCAPPASTSCSATRITSRCGRASTSIERAGGLHAFMGWDHPILTDSGGYQLVSLAEVAAVDDDSATFVSPYDGSRLRVTPEDAVRNQARLGADVLMCLDHPVAHGTATGRRGRRPSEHTDGRSAAVRHIRGRAAALRHRAGRLRCRGAAEVRRGS